MLRSSLNRIRLKRDPTCIIRQPRSEIKNKKVRAARFELAPRLFYRVWTYSSFLGMLRSSINRMRLFLDPTGPKLLRCRFSSRDSIC
jgi:hypothetical protein